MGNRVDATRLDPYGEYGHIKAVSLEEAARLYREAVNAPRGDEHIRDRIKRIDEATYHLQLSAYEAK